MRPATLAYLGHSAADVCAQLAQYEGDVRVLYAIDALVAAVAYMRMDTVSVLIDLGTPLDKKGLLGITVREAAGLNATDSKLLVQSLAVTEV